MASGGARLRPKSAQHEERPSCQPSPSTGLLFALPVKGRGLLSEPPAPDRHISHRRGFAAHAVTRYARAGSGGVVCPRHERMGRPGLRRWLHRRAHDGPWLRARGTPDGACRRSAKPIARSISRRRRRAETRAGSRGGDFRWLDGSTGTPLSVAPARLSTIDDLPNSGRASPFDQAAKRARSSGLG